MAITLALRRWSSPGRNPKIAASSVEGVRVVVLPQNAAVVDPVGEDVLLDLVCNRGPLLL
jgi:hypothetical protein